MGMSRLVTSQGFTSDLLSRFVSALLDTMPEPLNVCYLTNSGSEANDLSLRLASSHTGREDIVVLEDGYHGNIGSLIDASPKMHQRINHKKKDHIHIARLPDLYRGRYRYGDEQAGAKYAKDLEEVILQAESKGRRIGAFLFEPMLVIPGVYMPPPSYYQNVFRIVREHGGLVHAIEIVDNKEERIPSPDLASEIMFGMKTRQVLVAITGKQRNVILITPPMCFNMENCQVLVSALEDILTALNQNPSKIAIETIEPELEKPASKRIRLEDLESEERSDEESVEYDILCEMD